MKYEILGKVIKGDGYGRKLGFPTANIDRRDFSRKKLQLKLGVWAGWVCVNASHARFLFSPQRAHKQNGWYKAAIVIGPLDKNGLPKVEAHLLGFDGNLYGKKLMFGLVSYVRPWKVFKTEEALRKQISKDVSKIKNQIKNHER